MLKSAMWVASSSIAFINSDAVNIPIIIGKIFVEINSS